VTVCMSVAPTEHSCWRMLVT